MVPTYNYIFYYTYNVITRKWSTLYKRYVIWECSITTINPNYVNLMFSPHKAHNVLGTYVYMYEYEFLWTIYAWVSTYVFCRTPYSFTHCREKQAKIEHHQKYNTAITYTRCQMALCFQLIQEKEKIYVSHLKKKLLISLPWWFAYNFNYKMNGSKFLEM